LGTPLGDMWAATSERGLVGFNSSGTREGFLAELAKRWKADFVEEPSKFAELERQLGRYFRKEYVKFDLPLDQKGTDFQKRVWNAISEIPYGKLASYGWIAWRAGKPEAVRAAGNAVSANPLGLIVPCHRVVHGDGTIGGFGGGLPHKRQLLAWEGIFSTPEGEPERGVDLRGFFDSSPIRAL